MITITKDGRYFDQKQQKLVKVTLADILDNIREARLHLETWALCLQWDLQDKQSIDECISGISFWSSEEKEMLDLINSGKYAEVDSYASN